jgi:hypothetical protein
MPPKFSIIKLWPVSGCITMYLALKGKANKPTNLGPNELSTLVFSLGAKFHQNAKKENIVTLLFFLKK